MLVAMRSTLAGGGIAEEDVAADELRVSDLE